MRIILLGAPGCGKGTHSEWMTADYAVPQISTGDILRAAVAAGTNLGRNAKEYMDAGRLVPDEVILGLVRERLGEEDAQAGFILDGFPRTVPQAEGLGDVLRERGLRLDKVIEISVPREELIRRITSRRVCPSCKAVYNISFKPPKQEGICDICGASVIQRDDDTEATVARRLQVYEDQTAPLIEHYRDEGLLAVIDGNQGYENTRAQIRKALGASGR